MFLKTIIIDNFSQKIIEVPSETRVSSKLRKFYKYVLKLHDYLIQILTLFVITVKDNPQNLQFMLKIC